MDRFDSRVRRWLGAIAALAALYCFGALVAPWLEQHGVVGGSWLRLAYAPACHQLSDRCLNLGFGPLAVCSRCSGLYVGGLLGLLVGALGGGRVRPSVGWLVGTSTPTLLDFFAVQLGLPSLPNWPRFVVAIAPGIVVGLLLAHAVGDIATHVGRSTGTGRPDTVQ